MTNHKHDEPAQKQDQKQDQKQVDPHNPEHVEINPSPGSINEPVATPHDEADKKK